jgi:hypothetical protein
MNFKYFYSRGSHGLFFFEGENTGSGGGGKPTLTSVIEKAALDAAKANGIEVTEDAKETSKEVSGEKKTETASTDKKDTKETPKEESKKEEESSEDGLTKENLVAAKQLYQALSNKDTSLQTLQMLAKAAGFDLANVKTEKQAEKAEESLQDLLKEGLGEFDFLADKLGPVLEKALQRAIDKQTKDLREDASNRRQKELATQVNDGYAKAFAAYENSESLQDSVGKLINEFKPAAQMTYEAYFKSLIVIAADRAEIELKKVGKVNKEVEDKKEKKIEKNRHDVGSKLASERGAESKTMVRPSGKMKLNDAVQAAIEQLANQDK